MMLHQLWVKQKIILQVIKDIGCLTQVKDVEESECEAHCDSLLLVGFKDDSLYGSLTSHLKLCEIFLLDYC